MVALCHVSSFLSSPVICLFQAQHPNIVTVREIVVGSNMDKIFIVMDYVEHDLKSLMETMKQKKQVFIPGDSFFMAFYFLLFRNFIVKNAEFKAWYCNVLCVLPQYVSVQRMLLLYLFLYIR